jgi:hypothetical protein
MNNIVTYCADIGSIKRSNFGWYSSKKDCNRGDPRSIVNLAHSIAKSLSDGSKIALGFECPLFVPVENCPNDLTNARNLSAPHIDKKYEGNRSWSAGAGSYALTTGLVEIIWILGHVRRELSPIPEIYFNWCNFEKAESGIFLWEAFVTGKAKKNNKENEHDQHVNDAETAVKCFNRLTDPEKEYPMYNKPVFSLIGAALIRSGWSANLCYLKQPCLVVIADNSQPSSNTT